MADGDISDKLGNTHRMAVIANPGHLPTTIKRAIVRELTPVTSRGFLHSSVSQRHRRGVRRRVDECSRLLISTCGNLLSGYAAVSLRAFETDLVYHLEGIIVDELYQRSGLAFEVLRNDLVSTSASMLAFHTQSYPMWKLGMKLAELTADDAILLAKVIGTGHHEGDVEIGRYGRRSLYGDEDAFASIAIKDLDWRRGDAKICAGRVRLRLSASLP